MSRKLCPAPIMALALLVPFAAACQQPEAAPTEVRNCMDLLGAEVCTWAVLHDGAVTQVGLDLPLSVVEAVPADAPMTWPPQPLANLAFPDEAVAATGLTYAGIYWESHGHPPGPFLTPHFDLHFYSVGQEAVQAMDCMDESKPAGLPEGYELPDLTIPELGTLVGTCVPSMGMHAIPAADLEQTGLFEATMIVGYYGGSPIFIEPMIAQDFLLQRADFSLDVPSVEGVAEGVSLPGAFQAEYEEEQDSYRFVFSGFGSGA